jgi:hypothetical protein
LPIENSIQPITYYNSFFNTGALFSVVSKECSSGMVLADIASIGAQQLADHEMETYYDPALPRMGILNKIDSTFPKGGWSDYIKYSNTLLVNGTITQAQRTDRYVQFAKIKAIINSTSCLHFEGVTEFAVEQSNSNELLELGQFNKNNSLTSFNNQVYALQQHPNYSGNFSTVITVDSDRTYENTLSNYSNRLFFEKSFIKDKPAAFSDSQTITHFDSVSSIAGLAGGNNWQGHVAVPSYNNMMFGTGAGAFSALEYCRTAWAPPGETPNCVIVIPSSRHSVNWADFFTYRQAAQKGVAVVTSMSNENRIDDESSFTSIYNLSVGTIVNGIVQGTVGKYGPSIVVDVSTGAASDPQGGLFASFFSSILGGVKHVPSSGIYSSHAAEFVGQVIGNIMEVCPAATPQEIYRNVIAGSKPIPDYPALASINTRNNMVTGGIFDPITALKLTMVRNCPENVTATWTPVAYPATFDISTKLDKELWVIAKACTLKGGTLTTNGNTTASCKIPNGTPMTFYVWKGTNWGYTGYATDAKGKNARFI